MKTLPSKCLWHNVIIILIYVSFCTLSKHSTFLPNSFFVGYNGLILMLSVIYTRRDFRTNVFGLRSTISDAIRQVVIGFGAAILLSFLFACFAVMFEDVSLFPPLQGSLNAQDIIVFICLQIIIALAEEAFFNYYLYDTLMLLFSEKTVLSIIVDAFLFSFVHWVSNGRVKQVGIAFIFRLFALIVRKMFHKDNAFYICSSMHFFYNLTAYFIVSI